MGLVDFAIRRRVTIAMATVAITLLGMISLSRLKIGQAASISVDALAGRSFPAIVKLVSPTVDAATATFKVTLEVNDPKGDLKPGMFSRVGIVFERRSETLTIPRIALLDTDGTSNVFVVSSGKAEQRAIKTGLSNRHMIQVIEGLRDGETVVSKGSLFVDRAAAGS